MKKFLIIFLLIFSSVTIYADYIAFYPNVQPLDSYTQGFIKSFQYEDTNLKFCIVKESKIFSSPLTILKAVQSNLINFALIPLSTFQVLDISGNIEKPMKKVYNIKDLDSQFGDMIPFKLALQKYGIFLIDLLPGGEYYIFSNIDISFKKKVSFLLNNKLFFRKFKKIFPNTFFINNLSLIPNLISKKIFNTALLNTFDFHTLNMKFKNVYKTDLNDEKICFIANLNYWNNLNMISKSIIWDYYNKYKKKYKINLKKFQDRLLNRVYIKESAVH